MRNIILKVVVALTTFWIGAVGVWLFHASDKKASIPPLSVAQQLEHGPMIIEVSVFYGGMYSYVGELLELRVYESGYVEYDELDDDKPTRKSAELDRAELGSLISLSEDTELLSGKNEYPTFHVETDASLVETITLVQGSNKKTIVVHEPYQYIPYDPKSNYPSSLTSFLEEAVRIRRRLPLTYSSNN